MAEKITYRDVKGIFIPDAEWAQFLDDVSTIKQRSTELEKVNGEQQYKLKKLARIIQRKDRQLAKFNKGGSHV
ncbi:MULTISPECIES: hypothetical protein [Pseudoalteromonas]|uniref:Uncharacterized protein n=1 Tax=Pseudoalteromonas amylolytica TaxID=1859457 RepID=A0A1S1MY51_9GAMM|nr:MULTISPECIES: hypothetical protein [Pseudoalteromonas]OHU89182.1 hypothetical protein BFC16_05970 [Pseudoalteromonas sp. JW3]OHU92082.1 hypothetical protein BET10_07075 [Pseudoalteromonas amylolytica]